MIHVLKMLIDLKEIEYRSTVDAKFKTNGIMNEQKLLTKKEAANCLGVSVRTIERLIATGELTKIKILRSVKIKLNEIMRIIEQGC